MTSASVRASRTLRLFAAPALAFSLLASPIHVHAQASASISDIHAKGDIAGDWQGTLQAGKSLRLVAKITKAETGWAAKFYSIDQQTPAITVSSLTVDGSTVKMSIEMIGGTFQGTLSADGNSMTGTWTQGPNPLPLTLVRATKETAWEIPAPAPPPKMMPADASPGFDVVTIKPNDTGATSMQRLTINGRNFQTVASSLIDLISFAYDVQFKQIIGAPDWTAKDRYDVAGVPDVEGEPSMVQLRGMIRKLLADRYKLTFHKEKRDMPAFVLTVAKSGQKLKPTEMNGPLPGIGLRPLPGGVALMLRNATVPNLTSFLQMQVLDRPVVDQTAITGQFDITVNFTPDDSQFNGHPPKLNGQTPAADAPNAEPSLFEAMQQQLGLKLDAQKTAVEVIAIDHVEKPSAN